MQQLAKAISITSVAFEDKLDKGGVPYIMHCLHVMDIIGKKTDKDPEMMSIAVMHDLIEDTGWTIDALRAAGFSKRVCNGVSAMTHDPQDTYEEYIKYISLNPDARIVKLADLKHNSDPLRMKSLDEKHFIRLEKYHRAYAFLNNNDLDYRTYLGHKIKR